MERVRLVYYFTYKHIYINQIQVLSRTICETVNINFFSCEIGLGVVVRAKRIYRVVK